MVHKATNGKNMSRRILVSMKHWQSHSSLLTRQNVRTGMSSARPSVQLYMAIQSNASCQLGQLCVSSCAGRWEVEISKFGSQFVRLTASFSAFLILTWARAPWIALQIRLTASKRKGPTLNSATSAFFVLFSDWPIASLTLLC